MHTHGVRWLAAAILGILTVAPEMGAQSNSKEPFSVRTPGIIGIHRGGGHLWPEATLLAYTEGARRYPGALLEGDVRLTADGHVVMLHDATVDRTTGGSGPVSGMALEQVRALDAGYRFTRDGGQTFPYRGQGLQIPLFAEVLEALPEHVFLIDLKEGAALPAATIEVIRNAGATDRVVLASFVPKLLDMAREIAPEIPTAFGYPDGRAMFAAIDAGNWEGYQPVARMLCLPLEMAERFDVGPVHVATLRDKGVFTQVHTVNNPEDMRRFIAMGFDNILTDRPDLLEEALQASK